MLPLTLSDPPDESGLIIASASTGRCPSQWLQHGRVAGSVMFATKRHNFFRALKKDHSAPSSVMTLTDTRAPPRASAAPLTKF
jgi:hypothetical protein